MPKQTQDQDQGQREKLNWLIHNEVMPEIAKEFPEYDVLPTSHPNYDFFGRGVNVLQSMSKVRSSDLDHDTSIVIQGLIHRLPRPPKGQTGYTQEQKDLAKTNVEMFHGRLYKYKDYLDKNGLTPEKFPFDSYFVMCFKRLARNQIKGTYNSIKGRTPHFSTSGAGAFDEVGSGGALSEGILGDPSSPKPSARIEESERQEALDKVIPDLLAKERNAKILLLYYQMRMREGAKLWEVAERLDQLSETDSDYYPEGGGVDVEGNKVPWPISTLGRYETIILNIVKKYHRRKEWERNQRALTQEEKRAIFQSRRRA